ncbi:Triple Functional Domain Protein [Manis pentadactyla]|nr:Triple Functional Domain Protein [Manis pentadactyla]
MEELAGSQAVRQRRDEHKPGATAAGTASRRSPSGRTLRTRRAPLPGPGRASPELSAAGAAPSPAPGSPPSPRPCRSRLRAQSLSGRRREGEAAVGNFPFGSSALGTRGGKTEKLLEPGSPCRSEVPLTVEVFSTPTDLRVVRSVPASLPAPLGIEDRAPGQSALTRHICDFSNAVTFIRL